MPSSLGAHFRTHATVYAELMTMAAWWANTLLHPAFLACAISALRQLRHFPREHEGVRTQRGETTSAAGNRSVHVGSVVIRLEHALCYACRERRWGVQAAHAQILGAAPGA